MHATQVPNDTRSAKPTVVELCAGGGGQAIGLGEAGFVHLALVESNKVACETLRINRPDWPVWAGDLRRFTASELRSSCITLVAGGVPCQPFTIAGHQRGHADNRDLFPEAIRVTREVCPRAIMFENVAPLASPAFANYRRSILTSLRELGYYVETAVINAVEFGVPQQRRRFILVGRRDGAAPFPWPKAMSGFVTVGDSIGDLMSVNGWLGACSWVAQATQPAPTLVGGSDLHGGPDLGPSRARRAWALMRVDGRGIANAAPSVAFPHDGMPRLTLRMAARLQGFPDGWRFSGSKTAAYRQIGNAFPPPVARELALAVIRWLALPALPFVGATQQRSLF